MGLHTHGQFYFIDDDCYICALLDDCDDCDDVTEEEE